MKKLMITLCLALLTPLALASDVYKCYEGHKRTGFIYNLEKDYEDDSVVQLSLITKFGNCNSGAFESEEIIGIDPTARIYDDGWNIPFSKPTTEISAKKYSNDDEYKVTIKFFKKRLFKKKSVRNFGLHFRINMKRHKFIYGLMAKKKKDGNVDISIKNQSAFMSYTAY